MFLRHLACALWLSTPAVAGLQSSLADDFSQRLQTPSAYRARVHSEARRFPEGQLFPYVLPILAWGAPALDDPDRAANARDEMERLLEILLPIVAEKVSAPDGDLMKLQTYRGHGTWLGQTTLALSMWRSIGGARWEAEHKHLQSLLIAALDEREGAPIDAYPGQHFTFDTVPVLLALRLSDRRDGTCVHAERIERHLVWMDANGTEPQTGLPYFTMGPTWGPGAAPRGSDLGLRVALLSHVDPRRSKVMYEHMVTHLWHRAGPMAGFREWPVGREGHPDADSGPVVEGVGMSASGLGLAAARAHEDSGREAALRRSFAFFRMVRPFARRQIQASLGASSMSDDTRTGLLFGDAALFFASSWEAPKTRVGVQKCSTGA